MKFGAIMLCFMAIVGGGLCNRFASAQTLKCDTGPIEKTYGSRQWLVYSCDDGKSIVVVSAPGNPAMPFYFKLSPRGGTYALEGEGTGDKGATADAYDQLKKLSGGDIATLVKETQVGRNGPVR